MGERTEHAPGSFSWADLPAGDVEAAKAFYASLFGWEGDDLPMGDGGHYSTQRLGGHGVAAIASRPQPARGGDAPPAWQCYVTVASADEAAQRAGELGATVRAGPFDVMQAGRMAAIEDPQGASFMVWEPRESIGADLVNVPGALCWNELASNDPAASTRFYGELFGWTAEPFQESEGRYLVIENDGRTNGGIGLALPGQAPRWLPYFAVADVDQTLAQVGALGGSVAAGPFAIGDGKTAVAGDPEGALFGLYSGLLED
jgi:predicted enzyme related to lactoylglutathione lyase